MISDKPTPPRNLEVDEVTPESAHIKYEVPEDDGGSPITGYIVEKRDIKKKVYSAVLTTPELQAAIPKLVAKGQYCFRVAAQNEVGTSDWVESKTITAKWSFGELRFFEMSSSLLLCLDSERSHG